MNLAKPEFDGLWDQHKPYKVPKDQDVNLKMPGATKMDRVSSTSNQALYLVYFTRCGSQSYIAFDALSCFENRSAHRNLTIKWSVLYEQCYVFVYPGFGSNPYKCEPCISFWS